MSVIFHIPHWSPMQLFWGHCYVFFIVQSLLLAQFLLLEDNLAIPASISTVSMVRPLRNCSSTKTAVNQCLGHRAMVKEWPARSLTYSCTYKQEILIETTSSWCRNWWVGLVGVRHCTLYTVHCILYSVQCTVYSLHCTLYTVHCAL